MPPGWPLRSNADVFASDKGSVILQSAANFLHHDARHTSQIARPFGVVSVELDTFAAAAMRYTPNTDAASQAGVSVEVPTAQSPEDADAKAPSEPEPPWSPSSSSQLMGPAS
eukprot:CAMPEP_0206548060 /NCGR_PEP_ID=MMETSP0325_2-20121206/13664_1 /ASSEMBLY_ACC=CAM_ASM_000347 /TAXON_ID=2866 /ORGANISM="Crypthecodinium cohnii, Strain Seligo" /LENGTH=111 /DNA_ID=CAMNT_0054047479 /DNA_START=41 /DNA_END=377 /DNA_ORIENTATION=-